jgi:RHS repeat-associated protein
VAGRAVRCDKGLLGVRATGITWLGGKGRRTELPSGVVQMGVRSYIPAIGRFISTDPVPGGSANMYDANQGPINQFDLSGCYPLGSKAEFECITHCAKSHCGGHNFSKSRTAWRVFRAPEPWAPVSLNSAIFYLFKCAKDCVGKTPPPPPQSNAPHRIKPWWEYPIPLPILG